MFPIDEHAWGGAFVFAKFGRGFRVVRWDARCEWWEDQFGNALGSEHPTHYLPVPLAENAGAMREALTFMVSAFDAGMLPNKNILDDARKVLAAVKRSPEREPEPSEGERVEKVAAAIERELMTDEMLLADPATLRKIKSQRIARAALKAMKGE